MTINTYYIFINIYVCSLYVYIYIYLITLLISLLAEVDNPNDVSAFMECMFCKGKANSKQHYIQINKINSNLMIILSQRKE